MRYTHLASLKPDRFDINCILETVLEGVYDGIIKGWEDVKWLRTGVIMGKFWLGIVGHLIIKMGKFLTKVVDKMVLQQIVHKWEGKPSKCLGQSDIDRKKFYQGTKEQSTWRKLLESKGAFNLEKISFHTNFRMFCSKECHW